MTSPTLTLKERLAYLKDNPDRGTADLAILQEMLENIGSPDPVLRDDLIYETFATWIESDKLTPGELKQLMDTCLDDSHVFYKIGESGADSVFTRTFSLLVIALIIDAHRRRKFLTTADLREVETKMIRYMAEEKDVRGFVDQKGWAHSPAHAADVLGQLARCDELKNPEDMLEILNAIRRKVVINNYLYINKEDERMARAAVHVLNRTILDQQAIDGWLNSFIDIRKIDSHPEDDYLRVNVKMFLRSLYFQLLQHGDIRQATGAVEIVVQKFGKF
jgi:hypothetical protein